MANCFGLFGMTDLAWDQFWNLDMCSDLTMNTFVDLLVYAEHQNT